MQVSEIAKDRLNSIIERGKQRAATVIEQVETQIPADRIVPSGKMNFQPNMDGNGLLVQLGVDTGSPIEGFHRNALGQAAQRADVPMNYVDTLLQDHQADLLAVNFNRRFHETHGKSKFLTRSVNGQVRGFLSDRYRRLDARPLMDAFIKAAHKHGVVPADGYALDTKVFLQVLWAEVKEIAPGEYVVLGASYSNSDFGAGAVEIRFFVIRLICINGAIAQNAMRNVHLGRQLDENFEYSQKTYQLDTATMTSAVSDVAGHVLNPATMENFLEELRGVAKEKVDPKEAKVILRKHLLKGEAEKATELFNSADVEMLPPGNTTYRLSNAVSWLSNQPEVTEERKVELQSVAGKILTNGHE